MIQSSEHGGCPFANLQAKPTALGSIKDAPQGCPFHAHNVPDKFELQQDEDIRPDVHGGQHKATAGAAAILQDIGGSDRIREFCTRFYARAFLDNTINTFFFLDDGPEAHAKRLADWIIEKMDPGQKPWTDSGRLGQRQPSHHQAWNSVKRPRQERGLHFDLKDTRIWMRLHFWAARECGLFEHAPFYRYYVQFIEHFIAVYEREAPRYAEADANWSHPELRATNTDAYEQTHVMQDVLDNPGRRSMMTFISQGISPQLPSRP